jgi:hypothetical protein
MTCMIKSDSSFISSIRSAEMMYSNKHYSVIFVALKRQHGGMEKNCLHCEKFDNEEDDRRNYTL